MLGHFLRGGGGEVTPFARYKLGDINKMKNQQNRQICSFVVWV